MAVPTTECYRRNILALGAFQPAVATVIDKTPIPAGVTAIKGRDGGDTYMIPSASCGSTWLGRSSMPAVSAPEIFADFTSDGSNVLLPGIFTGVEPLVVLAKMPAHTALFVVEPDPLQLKLALHVRDYTDLLDKGRIIFIVGPFENLGDNLCAFLELHPGYDLPTHMLTAPQRSASEIAELQRMLATAGDAVSALHISLVQSHVQALRSRDFGALPPAPRVAVLGVAPAPVSLEQARRVAGTLERLGWPHKICIPDRPDKCHVTARLSAINDLSADLVLFINSMPGSMLDLLPGQLPVASWLLPGALVQAHPAQAPRERCTVFASSRTCLEQLVAAGTPTECTELVETGADDAMYHPQTQLQGKRGCVGAHVAVLMDLPDDRPEACRVELSSQLALWHALQRSSKRSADHYRDEFAERILDEAQHSSGTTLKDAKIRAHFLSLVRTHIAPATLARSAVEALIAAGCRVALWGYNWPPFGQEEEIRHGAIPVGDALNDLFNAVRVVLLPTVSPMAIQTALDALAAGACVVLRRPEKPFESEYAALGAVLSRLPLYRTSRELVASVGACLESRNKRSDPLAAARQAVLSEHTLAKRLVALVETLRRRQARAIQTAGQQPGETVEITQGPGVPSI